jgi:hypothetical protein
MKKDNNHHTVRDEYRTNPLSTRPGGSTVTAVMHNGRMLHYENIKNPAAYIRRASSDPEVKHFLVNGSIYKY